MDTQQQPQNETQTRRAALGGLAVVGFIALILIGIGTAIYAASFLPKAFSKLGGANVYLSSLDNGNGGQTGSSNPNIPVSSQPGTSVPLSPATSTAPASAQPNPTTQTTPAPAAKPSYTYTQPTYTYTPPAQNIVVPAAQSYYGLPDLTVTVNSVGYLTRRNDTTSFVSATNIPNGYQGAVRFTIANRGTNVAGNWNFRADLPSDTNGTYTSAYQRALNPGDSVIFTLGFDSSRNGSGNVRITVDPYGSVNESNESNNTDSGTVYFQNYGYNNNGGSYDSNGNYCSYGTYYSNGRYYCNSSYNSGSYDSNGNYCPNGTYYSGGRTYCNGYNNNYGNNNQYDSNGNYCSYGTYYSNGRYYCNGSSYNNNSGSYDSNGNYCSYGTYYSNGRYYCNDAYSRNNNSQYDSNGNYCWAGSYYSNGRTYCY